MKTSFLPWCVPWLWGRQRRHQRPLAWACHSHKNTSIWWLCTGGGAGRWGGTVGAILAHLSPLLLPSRTESGYRVSRPQGSSQYFGELMVNTGILKNMLLIGNCLPDLSLLEPIHWLLARIQAPPWGRRAPVSGQISPHTPLFYHPVSKVYLDSCGFLGH